ncbi:hypothetical protein NMG60_11025993 [Bertholletia excelsa]
MQFSWTTMLLSLSSLEARYLDSCKRNEVLPNSAVLSWFDEAKVQKSACQKCTIVVSLDCLSNADMPPLIDAFLATELSNINAIDIIHESNFLLDRQYITTLLRAINSKLRMVAVQDASLLDDFLCSRSLSHDSLGCQVLNLMSSEIRKLNITGRFMQLHTLNLDFCTSLTSLEKDCFTCMPNLTRLSMCETRVANLWTTSSALSKLPSLVELRFQNCLCCKGTGPCPQSSHPATDILVCDRMWSGHDQGTGVLELSSDVHSILNGKSNMKIEDSFGKLCSLGLDDPEGVSITFKKYASHHPSPICFESHYREYMIVMLPRLEVLDNIPIRFSERGMAKNIFSKHFEYLPYKRKQKECIVNVLSMREHTHRGKSKYFYSRSLVAAKLGFSAWPLFYPLSNICHVSEEKSNRLRPRQFEYHPSNSSLMVFGTMDGEIVLINHDNGHIIGYIPSLGANNSVLGLCWLKKYPSKLLTGTDNGSLRLYDINHMLPKTTNGYYCTSTAFDDFAQLTSIHANSTDDQFITSGYSKNVAVYDIGSGKCLQVFTDMHQGPINVAKFSHHSPSMFVTSSFDHDVKMWDLRQDPVRPCYRASSSRGNVMACFSPDDLYLLVSAVDNEVKQLLAADGRLHTKFEIASTGSTHNYTRSYYMNERDYIISGSSEEPLVRICCAQTGRRLRDVHLEARGSKGSTCVQSLRADPFRHFQMAVLASSTYPNSKTDIIKINMLSSSDDTDEYCYGQNLSLSSGLGG